MNRYLRLLSLGFVFAVLCAVTVKPTTALANSYTLDDVQIESLLEEAIAVSISSENLEMIAQQVGSNLNSHSQKLDMLNPNGEDQVVAIILCIFAGWFGVHRVYLGSTPVMILYYFLLSACCGVGGVIAFVDLLFLIFNGVDTFLYSNRLIAR